jgi:hypothetical protein
MEIDGDGFQANPLNYLPFELLEMIFELLKTRDLKNVLNLGERVRDVVIASPISMRKVFDTIS